MSTKSAKRDAAEAALNIAEDITAGKIDPADLDAELVNSCRELFGTVAGEGDPLFDLQRDVTRQVLAAGGLSADEVAEWLAVLRQRAQAGETPPAGPDIPAEVNPAANGPHSPESALEPAVDA